MELISDTYINRNFRIRVHYFKEKKPDGTITYGRSKMITAKKLHSLLGGRYDKNAKILKAINSKEDRIRIIRKEYCKIDFYAR